MTHTRINLEYYIYIMQYASSISLNVYVIFKAMAELFPGSVNKTTVQTMLASFGVSCFASKLACIQAAIRAKASNMSSWSELTLAS